MARIDLHIKKYVPEWTTTRFVVLDNSSRWASAIHREMLHQIQMTGVSKQFVPRFDSCETTRDTLLLCEMRNTVALILFAENLERECLSILGGLLRRRQTLPILLACAEHHERIVPVMLETGVDTVLYNVRSDVPASQWCLKVLQKHGAGGGTQSSS